MGVWATVNGIRAKVLECVVEWDGEEYFRVRYARDAEGRQVREGVPGIAAPWMIVWDGFSSPRLVPIRRTKVDENLTPKEVWDLRGFLVQNPFSCLRPRVSGTDITFGTEAEFLGSVAPVDLHATKINSSQFAISYQDNLNDGQTRAAPTSHSARPPNTRRRAPHTTRWRCSTPRR